MDTIDDRDKIIDLVARLREKESKAGRPKGYTGANTQRLRILKEESKKIIRENAHERLSAQEAEFASLLVNGASLVQAYEQAFPEECWAIVMDGDVETVAPLRTYEQLHSRANALSKKADVRSSVIRLLDQEEDVITHTASRLDNFIVKSLEKEAANQSNSASARIAALKALSEHRAVQTAESRSAEKAAATPDEVMERIYDRVKQLTSGKKEL